MYYTNQIYDVNASTIPSLNSIIVWAAGCLHGYGQFPYGILTTVSHEISHTFDPNGRKYDKDGLRLEGNWTDAEIAEYTLRIDQSIKYTLRRTEVVLGSPVIPGSRFCESSLPGTYVNCKKTLTESTADVIGLQMVCSLLNKDTSPQVEKTPVQVALETFALIYGGVMTKAALAEDVYKNVHLPDVVRGNYAPKHCLDFYRFYGPTLSPRMKFEDDRMLNLWGEAPQYNDFATRFVQNMEACVIDIDRIMETLKDKYTRILFVGHSTTYLYHTSKKHSRFYTEWFTSYKDLIKSQTTKDYLVVFVDNSDSEVVKDRSVIDKLCKENPDAVQFVQYPTTEDGPDRPDKSWCRQRCKNTILSPFVGDLMDEVFTKADDKRDLSNPYLRRMYI